jgi:tRNA-modifying protein YgfZ
MNAPATLEDVIRQAHALAHAAGVRVRDELRLLRVRGDDRLTWLNGQVTNDVRNIAPGTSVRALSINVRGKIMGELWITAASDQLEVFLAESALPHVMESFERYIIMEDVVLEADPHVRVISVQGPSASATVSAVPEAAGHAFAVDELGYGGMFVRTNRDDASALASAIATAAAKIGACAVSEAGYELARLRAKKPRFGIDFDEASYPQEAGLKSALSFNKGCYLGQEVVCTLESRGRLHRRLCLLESSTEHQAPAAGETLHVEPGQDVGTFTSAAYDPEASHWLAFGYIKRAQSAVGTELSSAHDRFLVRAIVGE